MTISSSGFGFEIEVTAKLRSSGLPPVRSSKSPYRAGTLRTRGNEGSGTKDGHCSPFGTSSSSICFCSLASSNRVVPRVRTDVCDGCDGDLCVCTRASLVESGPLYDFSSTGGSALTSLPVCAEAWYGKPCIQSQRRAFDGDDRA
jgi:hypothetical protein